MLLGLSFAAWFVVLVVILVFVLQLCTKLPSDFVFLGGMGLLLVSGVIPVNSVIGSFSSSTVVLIGALFVGIGCGFCVRVGGAVSGDDALAMCISSVLHIGVEKAYLITDLSVLALSMTYIPLRRISYSLLTVTLSGQIIGWIQRTRFRQKK